MNAFTLILLLGASGDGMSALVIHDHFDRLEINHVYDEAGRWQLTQLLCYDFKEIYLNEKQRKYLDGPLWYQKKNGQLPRRYVIQHWHMIQPSRPHLYPHKGKSGLYTVVYHDGNGVLRKLTAPVYEETHTAFDPEVWERAIWPKHSKRRGLSDVITKVARTATSN